MGGIQLLKMVWQSGPLFGLIILSIAYALPSPNDVVPENKLVSIDDATSSSPRASAEAVVASMLQTGADWTACSSLANTTRTEVTDEVERLQSMLDIEVDGCACAELGQDEVNRTNSLVTIANERVVTATRSLEVASNTQVQLTDQQFSLLQQEVCSWVHLDIGFTTVHATYEQAVIEKATAETEVTFTVRNYNEAVEEAARLKLECECQTRSAHDTAWAIANAETSRTERERAWAQAHHIDCVIAQTSEADCHIATAPDVSKPYMCPDVTSAACDGGETPVVERLGKAWGDSARGGDASSVDLTDVVDISCGDSACVARKLDGTGVAWGDPARGGDASSVDLTDLADISCGGHACVARKLDGTGLAWGLSGNGGDASSVDLTNLVDISCGRNACVARKLDGTGVAWGASCCGGTTRPSANHNPKPSVDLTDLVDISCGGYACVARKSDGTGVAWGNSQYGGDASSVDLTDLVDISCGGRACVARKSDGTGLAWGLPGGGDVSDGISWQGEHATSVDLTDLVDISCGLYTSCVARKGDGTGVAWGWHGQDFHHKTGVAWRGDATTIEGMPASFDLTDLADISCGGDACVARKLDGTGLAWGHGPHGGDASSVDLTDLVDISCGRNACVARKSDGTGLAWGKSINGGDASSVDLTNLVDISCGGYACVAR